MSKQSGPEAGFGAWLEAQMKACGFRTNVELESVTGIGNTTFSRWKSGAMTPSVDQLRKLTGPLKTPLLELLVRAGLVSTDEAKLPPLALARPVPSPAAPVADAIEADGDLDPVAKAHLLNQYEILRHLPPGVLHGVREVQEERRLAAVARSANNEPGVTTDEAEAGIAQRALAAKRANPAARRKPPKRQT